MLWLVKQPVGSLELFGQRQTVSGVTKRKSQQKAGVLPQEQVVGT